jgi:hypothetical protein
VLKKGFNVLDLKCFDLIIDPMTFSGLNSPSSAQGAEKRI